MTDTPPAEPRASDSGADHPGDDHPGEDHSLDREGEPVESTAVSATPVPQSAEGSPDAGGDLEPEGASPDGGDGNGDIEEAGAAERPGRARTIALLAAAIAVILVAVTLVGGRVLGWWGTTGTPAAEPSPSPSPTQMMDPFAGTPAEDFPEGADGIVLPEPEPVGDFTAEEVADALEQVREALIAARLDHTMLVDHNPEPFIALLAPDQFPAIDHAFDSKEFAKFATFLGRTEELAVLPKVQVDVQFELAHAGAQDTEIVEVTTHATWAYALLDTERRSPTRIVVVADHLTWEVRIGEPWLSGTQGLWLADAAVRAWGADCQAFLSEGVLLRSKSSSPVRLPDDVFQAQDFLESGATC